jgi:hypothetical protein
MALLDSDDLPYESQKVGEVFARVGLQERRMTVQRAVMRRNHRPNDRTGFWQHTSVRLQRLSVRLQIPLYRICGRTDQPHFDKTQVCPPAISMPDPSIRTSAYDLVLKGATVIADIYSLDEMLSSYRLHGDNTWYASSRRQSRDFLERVDAYLSQKLAESGLFSGASLYDSVACCTELVVDRKWLT